MKFINKIELEKYISEKKSKYSKLNLLIISILMFITASYFYLHNLNGQMTITLIACFSFFSLSLALKNQIISNRNAATIFFID